jgi:hypothetical protein
VEGTPGADGVSSAPAKPAPMTIMCVWLGRVVTIVDTGRPQAPSHHTRDANDPCARIRPAQPSALKHQKARLPMGSLANNSAHRSGSAPTRSDAVE